MAMAASSVIRYCRFFEKQNVTRVLDYGAGTLRNALYLTNQGFSVYAADIPEQVKVVAMTPLGYPSWADLIHPAHEGERKGEAEIFSVDLYDKSSQP